MKSKMFAVVPALCFIGAVAKNIATINWRTNPVLHSPGSAMIASAFAILTIAHFASAASL